MQHKPNIKLRDLLETKKAKTINLTEVFKTEVKRLAKAYALEVKQRWWNAAKHPN